MDERIAVFDTETTGLPKKNLPLDNQPFIVEIAIVVCDSNFKPLEKFESLIRPLNLKGDLITSEPKAFAAHKITDEELFNKPPFGAIYDDLCDLLLGVQGIAAHNFNFDITLLKYALMRINKQTAFPYPPMQICTMQSTKQFHPKGRNLSMEKLYKHLFGIEKPTAHRAMSDVQNLIEICAELRKRGVI